MKKSTKILTFLLAACLLFGISSAFATSAAETNVLNVTHHSANVIDDCTSGPKGTEYTIASTGNSLYFGYENSVKSLYMLGSHVKDNTGENSYIRIHYDPTALESGDPVKIMREATTRWRAYTTYNAAADLKNYQYMTLDFDFAADAYAYSFTLNGDTQYKTAASDEEFKAYLSTLVSDPVILEELYEEALATRDLAFPADESLRLRPVFQSSLTDNANTQGLSQSSSSAAWKQVQGADLFVFKLDDGWYVGKEWDSAEGAARLSNKPGIFDHITMVFEILDGGLTVREHVYINGSYMATMADKTMDGQNKKYNTFYHLAIPFYANKTSAGVPGDKMYDKYSFAFDNMALNYYDAEDCEVSGGLAEFMKSDEYTTGSLMDCTNVVCNGDFVSPNAPVRAAITHLDGTQLNCYTKNSVYNNIRNGDFVTMYFDVDNYSPNPDEITEVTFISVDNTKLALSKAATEYFKVQHTNDRYTVRFGSENDMTIKWFNASGEGREVAKEQKLFPLQKPANNLLISGEIDFTGEHPTIGLLNAWLWDVDCDGVGDKPASEILDRVFTMAEINDELRESGIKEIHLVPDYIRENIYYTITTDSEKKELYVPDYDFAKFTDPATLASAVSKLEKGNTYYVTLYADVELDATAAMTLPANVVLDFDLNGYKLAQTAESGSAIFNLGEGSTLNLYSTKAGAEVYQSGDALIGSAMISANDIDAATVNLSKITEADAAGDNLTVYGASIVYLKGSESDVSNDSNITVNVNGGNYYGTAAANGALFMISEMDMIFNVNSADIITVNGESIFTVVADYATSAVIDVTGSKLFAGEITADGYSIGAVIGEWSSTSKAYIKKSVVLGFENQFNVTLGAGNKLNAKVSADIAYDGETVPAFSNNNVTVENLEFTAPGLETVTVAAEITLITYTKDTIANEASVKTVTWLDPNGSAYKTCYWVAGSIVSIFESTEDFAGKDLDNKWFDISYEGWFNVTEGVDKNDFTVSSDKENKFAPAEKYLADMKSLKVSLTVFDGLAYNIYVPTPVVDKYTMSFIGFFDANGNQISANVYNGVTVDGTEGWNQLIGVFASDEFAAQTVTVKYTVNGQEVAYDVKVDIFNYAYKIDTAYGCGSAESKLVYAMMQYKYEVFTKTVTDADIKEAVDAEMDKYYSFHGEDCTCGDVEYTEPTITADDSAISAIVAKYSFALVVDEENNFASKYVFSIFLTENKTVKINGNTVKGVANGEYFEYSLSGVALADLANDITITIDSASGTYSLAKCIKDTDSDFVKALYVLSVNAKTQNA